MMSGITHLGHYRWVAGLAVSFAVWSFFKRIKGKQVLILPWVGILLALGLAQLLKEWVARSRPFEMLSGLRPGWGDGGEAFPSGHATGAFALATALSLQYPRLAWVWWPLAFGIGLSRVALGEHWPSDVWAGGLLGVAVVMVSFWMEKRVASTSKNRKR